MASALEETLRRNQTFLVENLDLKKAEDRLLKEGLLGVDDVDEMTAKGTREDEVAFLLDKLSKRGPQAFDVFIKVLREADAFATKKLTSGNFDDECDGGDDETYKPISKGKAVIIVNREFGLSLTTRIGAERDVKTLQNLFEFLNFDVVTYENVNESRMRNVINRFAQDDHSKIDCVAMAISSHGRDEEIYSSDESLVPVSQITSPFRYNPTLLGKPKLFFIQACRGERQDKGIDVPDGKRVSDTRLTIPTDSDFLLAFATTPGYASFRNSLFGSWFVQALDSTFRARAHEDHLLDLLTRVNRKVAIEFKSNPGQRKQMPAIVSMLTKKLYLLPPRKN
ncbi:caspase-3-like [Oscarella lobularis]|uniref:caspase-3-like n=1 Tax=Oscarella lobularis TaxID=121494 RepID=UPI003313B6B6